MRSWNESRVAFVTCINAVTCRLCKCWWHWHECRWVWLRPNMRKIVLRMHEWIHLFPNPATASVYGGDASLREKLSRTLIVLFIWKHRMFVTCQPSRVGGEAFRASWYLSCYFLKLYFYYPYKIHVRGVIRIPPFAKHGDLTRCLTMHSKNYHWNNHKLIQSWLCGFFWLVLPTAQTNT
jgi:hypothetical protein